MYDVEGCGFYINNDLINGLLLLPEKTSILKRSYLNIITNIHERKSVVKIKR